MKRKQVLTATLKRGTVFLFLCLMCVLGLKTQAQNVIWSSGYPKLNPDPMTIYDTSYIEVRFEVDADVTGNVYVTFTPPAGVAARITGAPIVLSDDTGEYTYTSYGNAANNGARYQIANAATPLTTSRVVHFKVPTITTTCAMADGVNYNVMVHTTTSGDFGVLGKGSKDISMVFQKPVLNVTIPTNTQSYTAEGETHTYKLNLSAPTGVLNNWKLTFTFPSGRSTGNIDLGARVALSNFKLNGYVIPANKITKQLSSHSAAYADSVYTIVFDNTFVPDALVATGGKLTSTPVELTVDATALTPCGVKTINVNGWFPSSAGYSGYPDVPHTTNACGQLGATPQFIMQMPELTGVPNMQVSATRWLAPHDGYLKWCYDKTTTMYTEHEFKNTGNADAYIYQQNITGSRPDYINSGIGVSYIDTANVYYRIGTSGLEKRIDPATMEFPWLLGNGGREIDPLYAGEPIYIRFAVPDSVPKDSIITYRVGRKMGQFYNTDGVTSGLNSYYWEYMRAYAPYSRNACGQVGEYGATSSVGVTAPSLIHKPAAISIRANQSGEISVPNIYLGSMMQANYLGATNVASVDLYVHIPQWMNLDPAAILSGTALQLWNTAETQMCPATFTKHNDSIFSLNVTSTQNGTSSQALYNNGILKVLWTTGACASTTENIQGEINYWINYNLPNPNGLSAACSPTTFERTGYVKQDITFLCKEDGFVLDNFSLRRISRGYLDTDNDNVPDNATLAPDSDINHYQYMAGDTLEVIWKGSITNSLDGSVSTFNHLYLLLETESALTISSTGANYVFVPMDDKATISINGSVATSAGLTYKRLSNNRLYIEYKGNLTAGQEVEVRLPARFRSGWSNNPANPTITGSGYVSNQETATPNNPFDSPQDKYGEDEMQTPPLIVRLLYFNMNSSTQTPINHNNPTTFPSVYYYDPYVYIGQYAFTNEARISRILDTLTIIMPDGYEFTTDTMAIIYRKYKNDGTFADTRDTLIADIFTSDSLMFDLRKYFDADNLTNPQGGKHMNPVEFTRVFIYPYYRATKGAPSYTIGKLISKCTPIDGNEASQVGTYPVNTQNIGMYYTGAGTSLVANVNTISVTSSAINIPVLSLSNTGSSRINNVWMYVEGNVSNVKLTTLGGATLSGTGFEGRWINVAGYIDAGGNALQFSFDGTYTGGGGCTDQLRFHIVADYDNPATWNPAVNPSSNAPSGQTGAAINYAINKNDIDHEGAIRTVTLNIPATSVGGSLSVSNVSASIDEGQIAFNSKQIVTAKLNTHGSAGMLSNGVMTITVPAGQEYVTGTAKIAYPSDATPVDISPTFEAYLKTTIGEGTSTATDRTFTFHFGAAVGDSSAMINGTGTVAEQEAVLTFDINPDCNTSLTGLRYSGVLSGESACGEIATNTGKTVYSASQFPKLNTNYGFKMTNDLTSNSVVSVLENSITSAISITKTYGASHTVDPKDSLELQMHPAFNVASASYASGNGTDVFKLGSNKVENGLRKVRMSYPSTYINGVSGGAINSVVEYNVTLSYDPTQFTSLDDEEQPFTATVVSMQQFDGSCPAQEAVIAFKDTTIAAVVFDPYPGEVCPADSATVAVANENSVYTHSWFYDAALTDGIGSGASVDYLASTATKDTLYIEVSKGSDILGTIRYPYSTYAAVVANFVADSACIGSETFFTDKTKVGTANASTSNVSSWAWYADGETTPFATTQHPNNTFTVGEHTITLIVESKNGCTDTIKNKIVVYPLPVPTITGNSTSCAQGTTVYSTEPGMSNYVWTVTGGAFSGQGTDEISVIWNAAGQGKVTVTYREHGCPAASPAELDVLILSPMTASISSQTNITCNGDANGEATVTVNGGTSPYTYLWTPSNATTAAATGLSAGANVATVTDANGCVATATATITQPTVLTANNVVTPPSAPNSPSTVMLIINGGTQPYSYSTTGSAPFIPITSGGTFTMTTSGTVTVRDANNCEATTDVTVSTVDEITGTLTPTAVTTPGGTDGQVAISNVSGGNGGTIQYILRDITGTTTVRPWQTGLTFTGLPAGEYTVYARNVGETYESSLGGVIVSAPGDLQGVATAVAVSCNGGTDGSITAYVSDGGTAPYYIQLEKSSDNSVVAAYGTTTYQKDEARTFSGLSADTYQVRVKDAANHTTHIALSVVVSEPAALVGTISSKENASCNGVADGSATVTVTGGTAPYQYAWAPSGGTSATASNLAAGIYTVTITDAKNCVTTATTTISQPAALVVSNTVSNPTCPGQTASAAIGITGGTSPYQYSLTGVAPFVPIVSGGSISNLSSNTTVTVQDSKGCEETTLVNVTLINAITAVLTPSNVTTPGGTDGSITISNPQGGIASGTIEYTVRDISGTTTIRTWNTGLVFPGLPAGDYTVYARNLGQSCESALGGVVISAPGALQGTAIPTSVSCNGGNDGKISVSNVSGGTAPYEYQLEDANGSVVTAYTTAVNFTGLTAGTYQVRVKDANNADALIAVGINVTQPTAVLATISAQINVSCNLGNDGSATVTVSGGTAPYTYAWLPSGGSAATASGLSAGTYTVTVTDAKSCPTTATVTITEPTALAVSNTVTNPQCSNETATVTVFVSGGTSAYGYSLSGVAPFIPITSGGNITGISADGTITIQDSKGCTEVSSYTVTLVSPITGTLSKTDVSIPNGSDGSITVSNPQGGNTNTKQYEVRTQSGVSVISWTSNTTLSGLTSGNYTVYARNVGQTCEYNLGGIVISEPGALQGTASFTAVTCKGGNDGSITTEVTSGGTAPFQYQLERSNNSVVTPYKAATSSAETFAGLVAGTYQVRVKDANNAIALIAVDINVTEPTALTAAISSQTNVTCNGFSTGSATVTASGGTAPYTYAWSPSGGNSATASNLAVDVYTVTVSDANGCTATATATITEPAALVVSNTVSNPTCPGQTASATIGITGGTTPYQYSLTGSAPFMPITSGGSISNLSGNTTVTIQDANSCESATVVTVTLVDVITAGLSKTDVSVPNGTDGSIIISSPQGGIASGTIEYTVRDASGVNTIRAWNTSTTFGGLSAGDYTVFARNVGQSCESSIGGIIISEPGAINGTASPVAASCYGGNDGVITAEVTTGGTSPYQYQLETSSGVIKTPYGTAANLGDPVNFSGLTAGSYQVRVKDNAGAIAMIAVGIIVTEPAAVSATITSQTNVSCFGVLDGSATVTAAGGTAPYTYAWSPSGGTAATANGLSAGTYTVTVSDANGCTGQATVTITQPTALAVNNTVTNPQCHGETASTTVFISGGTTPYGYSLNGVAPFIPIVSGGSITNLSTSGTITIADANGCEATTPLTVTMIDAITGTLTKADVSVPGGSDGSITVTNPLGGNTNPKQYEVRTQGGVSVISWTTNTVLSGLPSGSYTVYARNTGQTCEYNLGGMVISEPGAITGTATNTAVSCKGGTNGSITAEVTSGGTAPFQYQLERSNNSVVTPYKAATSSAETFAGLTAGTYQVRVKDNAGAIALIAVDINVTEPTAVTASIASQTNVTCNGLADGTATVIAAGGTAPYTYVWTSGGTAATASGLSANTYTVTVSDANGCTAQATATITEPAILVVSNTVTNPTCPGQAASATIGITGGTSPYQYSLTGAAPFMPIASGGSISNLNTDVTVTIQDANGCEKTTSVSVTLVSSITASLSKTDVTTPGGTDGSIIISNTQGGVASGTVEYTVRDASGVSTVRAWNTSTTFSGLPAGDYTVFARNVGQSCESSLGGIIVSAPGAIAGTVTPVAASCNGGNDGVITAEVISGGTAPYQYQIETSAGVIKTPYGTAAGLGDPVNFSGLTAGSYQVRVKDNAGAIAMIGVGVIVSEPTAVSATISGQTNVTCNGLADGTATVTAGGGTAPYTYAWAPSGGTAATASGLVAGTYTVTVSDVNGCSATATVTITEPTALVVSNTVTDPQCFGETASATIVVSGGTPGYEYSLNGVAPFIPIVSGGSITDLNTTTVVTIQDANGCKQTTSVSVTLIDAITAILTKTDVTIPSGNDGSIIVNSPLGGNGMPVQYQVKMQDGTPVISWTNNTTLNGLVSGSYTVYARNAGQICEYNLGGIVITEPGAITGTASSTAVSCKGGSDGTITALVASGGTSPYEYQLERSNNSIVTAYGTATSSAVTFSGLSAGTYQVRVKDNAGAVALVAVDIIVTEPTALGAVISAQTNATCNGLATGSATVTATGGTAPYTYAWSPSGGVMETAGNLMAGTYTVTVTDDNGCTTTATATITEPISLVVSNTVSDPTCPGQTASTAIAITGGTSPYQYSLTGVAPFIPITSGGVISGLSSDVTVTIQDANACEATTNVSVVMVSSITANLSKTDVSIPSGSDGSIIISNTQGGIASGIVEYTVRDASGVGSIRAWSTTTTFSGLPSGDYTVFARNVGQTCESAIGGIIISEPGALQGTAVPTVVSCNGGNNGSITAEVTAGGTGPYQYQLETPTNVVVRAYGSALALGATETFSGLSAGTYQVRVKDVNSAIALIAVGVIVTEPTPVSTMISAQTNVSCNGGSNGSATATATGGTSPYTYTWDDASSSVGATVSGLSAGTYTVTAADAYGCVATATVTITEPTAIVVSNTVVNPQCSNGTATATIMISGGTSPYGYSLNGVAPFIPIVSGGTISDLSTDVVVTIEDAKGCTETTPVSVIMINPITATLSGTDVTIPSGTDGIITVSTPQGGNGSTIQYEVRNQSGVSVISWTTNTVLSGLISGNYSVFARNVGQTCEYNLGGIVLAEPGALQGTASSLAVSCKGGTDGSVIAEVTAGGTSPFKYQLERSNNSIVRPYGTALALGVSETITGLSAGTYQVRVQDAAGATAIIAVDVIVTEPTALTAGISNQVNVSCNTGNDGSATVTASGGTSPYTYLWDDAMVSTTATATGLSAGVYTVIVTDANGCTTTAAATITEPTALVVSNVVTNPTCPNQAASATVAITGGTSPYQYSLTGQAPFIPIVSGGTISNLTADVTVTIQDSKGCEITTLVSVTMVDIITANLAKTDVTVPGGINGTITISGTQGGNGTSVEYTVRDITGVTVVRPWNATTTFTGLPSGDYTIYARNTGEACETLIGGVIITEPDALQGTATPTSVLCYGGNDGSITAEVTAGGTAPYQYQLETSTNVIVRPYGTASALGNTETFAGLTAGTYQVRVKDANGAIALIAISVIVTEPAAVTVTTLPVTLCQEDVLDYATLGTSDPLNTIHVYDALTGGTELTGTVAVTATAIYYVEAENMAGCVSERLPVKVTVNTKPSFTITTPGAICSGETVELKNTITGVWLAEYDINYYDAFGNVLAGSTVTPDSTSDYRIELVSKANGCRSNIETVTITVNPRPEAAILSDVTICSGARTGILSIYTNQSSMDYAIEYSLEAQGAGFVNIAYTNLSGMDITLDVPASLPKGEYGATLIVNNNGCENAYPFTISVSGSARIIRHPESISDLCDSASVLSLSVEAEGEGLSYQWYHNGTAIVGAEEAVYEIAYTSDLQGKYYVDVISSCGSTITSRTVTVENNTLGIDRKWEDVLYVFNEDVTAVSYQWYKNGRLISKDGNGQYYIDPRGVNGIYQVELIYADGSSRMTCATELLPIQKPDTKSEEISVYPNPVLKGQNITVEIKERSKSTTMLDIEIIDLLGRKVYQGTTENNVTEIPVQLVSGSYIVYITTSKGKVTTHKLIVK